MFDFLKPKKKPPSNPYKTYIDALQTMVYDGNLSAVFYNRESRILLITTYSENLSELVDKAYRNELGTRLMAVNLHHYLKHIDVDRLKVLLGKLLTLLNDENTALNNHSKNDIQALIEAYELLRKI